MPMLTASHIRTLLLTLFYRYFRPLLDGGYIYIAQSPLYKIKKGKELFYFYDEEEKNSLSRRKRECRSVIVEEGNIDTENTEAEAEGEADEKVAKKKPKILIQRYKGLGEMNAEELSETTMDASKRVLRQVTIDDAEEADKVIDILMGSDVAPRKSFIQSNAKNANIDV